MTKRFGGTAIGIALLTLLLVRAGAAQNAYSLTERTDAAERSRGAEWTATPETGAHSFSESGWTEGMASLLVLSPDGRFLLLGEPAESGLDVAGYRLFLVALERRQLVKLENLALGATFSPTSEYLFIETGPHPVLYNLQTHQAEPIVEIESGLENYPAWVADWSADEKELIIHQQQRFDILAEPRAWTLRLP